VQPLCSVLDGKIIKTPQLCALGNMAAILVSSTWKNNKNTTIKYNKLKKFIYKSFKKSFLFMNYTDIFNKICKDELNLEIMYQFLIILQAIEDGQVDQHEGSVLVGKLLKELYIDSALRRGENLDKEYASQKVEPIVGKKITWKEYKQLDCMRSATGK
jgi:hypothetical protein